MPGRRQIAEIKQDNYGMDKYFRLKNYNRSTTAGYTVTITIWSTSRDGTTRTKLVDAAVCTAAYDGEDTIITYVPTAPSPFALAEDYEAEINFTKSSGGSVIYKEDSKTFAWRVIPSP